MTSYSTKPPLSADDIRQQFASFLNCLPKELTAETPHRKTNGVSSDEHPSKIREILNKKLEQSYQSIPQTKTSIFINQQVSRFQETLINTKQDFQNLQGEHLRIIREYDGISAERDQLRSESAKFESATQRLTQQLKEKENIIYGLEKQLQQVQEHVQQQVNAQVNEHHPQQQCLFLII